MKEFPDPLGNEGGTGGVFDIFEKNHEFVAGQAGESVTRTNETTYSISHLYKKFISRQMAQTIVDKFEAIEVEE
jgi:hypothetical protein